MTRNDFEQYLRCLLDGFIADAIRELNPPSIVPEQGSLKQAFLATRTVEDWQRIGHWQQQCFKRAAEIARWAADQIEKFKAEVESNGKPATKEGVKDGPHRR